MTGMAERLTYLLGICVAVISWSVTQLSTNLSNEDVIGYRLETKSVDDRSDATLLHLENLGRTVPTGEIIVSDAVNYIESPRSAGCDHPNLAYYPDLLGVKVSGDSTKKKGYLNIAVPALTPGAFLDVYVAYPHNCSIVPVVQVAANSHARLLRFGMETWVIAHRFAIIIALIVIFGIIFAIAFATSIRVARTAPP